VDMDKIAKKKSLLSMHLEMLEGFKKIHQERFSVLSNFNSQVKRNNFLYPEINISLHAGENEKLSPTLH